MECYLVTRYAYRFICLCYVDRVVQWKAKYLGTLCGCSGNREAPNPTIKTVCEPWVGLQLISLATSLHHTGPRVVSRGLCSGSQGRL